MHALPHIALTSASNVVAVSRLVPSVLRALREATQRAERKRAEEALRQSETYLAEAQRLSQTGSFGWRPSTGEILWSEETFRIFEYDRATKPTVEVILERVPEPKAKATRAKPVLELAPFQPVERDFAFIVDRAVKAGDISRAAQGVDRKLIAGVSVFDVYEGKGIDSTKKSVAIAVTIQPREKTLTDQEIDAVAAKIVAEVTKKTSGTLRA